MVACSETLTAERKGKKLCARCELYLENCGYRYNAETENYYVRNRYYSPPLGRWLTRDPIGYRGGINLYGYVNSSPVGNVDAEGLATYTLGTGVEAASPNSVGIKGSVDLDTPTETYSPTAVRFGISIIAKVDANGHLEIVYAGAHFRPGQQTGGTVSSTNPHLIYQNSRTAVYSWNPVLVHHSATKVIGGVAGAVLGGEIGGGIGSFFGGVGAGPGVLIGVGIGFFIGYYYGGAVSNLFSASYSVAIHARWKISVHCGKIAIREEANNGVVVLETQRASLTTTLVVHGGTEP